MYKIYTCTRFIPNEFVYASSEETMCHSTKLIESLSSTYHISKPSISPRSFP